MSRSFHILIVDDHAGVAKALADFLRREGHRVATALSGRDGIEAVEHAHASGDPFVIVFTDFSMQDVDGLTVAAAVKAAAPSTNVVLVTAYRLGADDERPPNVDQVLTKPPRLQDLRNAILVAAGTGG